MTLVNSQYVMKNRERSRYVRWRYPQNHREDFKPSKRRF